MVTELGEIVLDQGNSRKVPAGVRHVAFRVTYPAGRSPAGLLDV
jgi:hypothetical protein